MLVRALNFRPTGELLEGLATALRWRQDVAQGEMVECPGYTRSYCDVFKNGITSDELDFICETANEIYEKLDSPLRIGWSMGELRPYIHRQRDLFPKSKE